MRLTDRELYFLILSMVSNSSWLAPSPPRITLRKSVVLTPLIRLSAFKPTLYSKTRTLFVTIHSTFVAVGDYRSSWRQNIWQCWPRTSTTHPSPSRATACCRPSPRCSPRCSSPNRHRHNRSHKPRYWAPTNCNCIPWVLLSRAYIVYVLKNAHCSEFNVHCIVTVSDAVVSSDDLSHDDNGAVDHTSA